MLRLGPGPFYSFQGLRSFQGMLKLGLFLQVLTAGKRIFIDDGLISIVALEIGEDFVIGEVENGGSLGSRKGCNLPGTDTDLVIF